MGKKHEIKLEQAVKYLHKYIEECDADELGRILGECFGGECFTRSGSIYNFEETECFIGFPT